MKSTELERIMKKIPDEKQNEASLLYDELIFILETIKELKLKISTDGAVERFEQGKQSFLRESPALTGYNKLMKTYDTFYKNLIALIPKGETTTDNFEDDEL